MDYLLLLLAGFLSGVLTSLFGLGGGLTVVPILLLCLPLFGIPQSLIMHMAIGTSLLVMLINNCLAAVGHYRANNIIWPYFRAIALFMIAGTILGTFIATYLNGKTLILIFLLFLIVIMIRYWQQIRHQPVLNQTNQQQVSLSIVLWQRFYGSLAGIISACAGGGCSLVMLPLLKRKGLLTKQAVGLVVMFNILVAGIAVISYTIITHRLSMPLPRYSTGFIYWPALIPVMLGALLGIPIGQEFRTLVF